MNRNSSWAVVVESLLMLPAVVFFAALVLRNLQPLELATMAQRIFAWYSARFWTAAWLLFALPAAALTIGCIVLSRKESQPATRLIEVVTCGAGTIVAIVVLHALRN